MRLNLIASAENVHSLSALRSLKYLNINDSGKKELYMISEKTSSFHYSYFDLPSQKWEIKKEKEERSVVSCSFFAREQNEGKTARKGGEAERYRQPRSHGGKKIVCLS